MHRRKTNIGDNLVPNKASGITSMTLEWKSSPKDIKRPGGVAFTKAGEQLIVVDCDGKCAKVLNVASGEILETIANQHAVYDVCVSANEKTILFSNCAEEQIEEYRVTNRNKIYFYNHWHKRKQTPRGVTVNTPGQYLIVNKEPPAVYSYSCAPRVSELDVTPQTFGEEVLKSPAFICTDKLNKYYVSDEILHQVIVFNAQGHMVGRLGQKGSGPGELLKPQGVAVDDWGNVLIADCLNDRVSVFSSDGRFLRHVLCTHAILRPVGLVINNNTVVVTQQYMNWCSVGLYTVDL